MAEEDFYLPDISSVRRNLRQRGLWPVKIQEQKPPSIEFFDIRGRNWTIQLLRALRFQTATVSAGTAFLNIIEGENDPRRRLAFLPARTILKGGGSFADALKALKLFDAATLAIIMAGERAGDLKGVLMHAIEHVEEKGKQYKTFIAAVGWLGFDIFSIISSIWGAQFGFIPYLKETGVQNGTPEQVEKFNKSLELASLVNGGILWFTSLLAVFLFVLGYTFWKNRGKSDHWAGKMVMKLPLFGSYIRHSAMHDTCKLMGRLLHGKVPLTDALKIIIETTIEPSARGYWNECRNRILGGIDPGKALSRWPLEKSERDQIMTVQSVDQLSEVFDAIASERSNMAKSSQRKIVQAGIMAMMLLFGVVTLTMVGLLAIQNQGMLDNLQSMKGG